MSETTTPGGAGTAVGGRRRARLLIVVTGISLVVLGIAAAVVWSVLRTAQGPAEAVRDYAALIAEGKAGAASSLVDPVAWAEGREGVASVLVSDEVLASSLEPFSVLDIELGSDGTTEVAVGSTVLVEVDYAVGDERGRAALRVEREHDGPFGASRWRVVDPLVVPIVVESNVPTVGPATLGGEPIDLSGPSFAGAEQLIALVYPGEYQVIAPERTAFSAATEYVLALSDAEPSVEEPSEGAALPVAARVQLTFDPTPELVDTVSEALDEHLDACLEEATAMPDDCPAVLAYLGRTVSNLTITERPEIDVLGAVGVDYVDGVPSRSPVGLRSTIGVIEYTGEDGARRDESFRVVADLEVHGDAVDIVFRSAA
ncbi:hypothetical protein N1028_17895 [Herbiconiux sp. CPCC 203407]|uniref:Uncharacterized protein n=1 Tax=Herbiconiux oxytropis TaxID=2970915 RepID=A0AA41XGW1_9MICO|nr:hypothetical protein [Herbiconiux oxytropis]MCS5722842.1 hypothetical protein [Herbiconiux oxytropis]MCS5727772.1 hypothetical protein [Herbiconiux oxytropis]